jgi:hypothetical protein
MKTELMKLTELRWSSGNLQFNSENLVISIFYSAPQWQK